MRLVLLLVACSVFIFANAQRPGNANRSGGQQMTGRFYGRVVDASNKGIDAASVLLVQDKVDTATRERKEIVMGGMLTASNGDFS